MNTKASTPHWGAGGGGFPTNSGQYNQGNGGTGGGGVVIVMW